LRGRDELFLTQDGAASGVTVRALVTGATGFSGQTLALHLAATGWSVTASHSGKRQPSSHLDAAGVKIVTHDFESPDHLANTLEATEPDVVFHMSGQTSDPGGHAFGTLLQSHPAAASALLEAVRLVCPDATVLIPGSSAQFGDVPAERQPINEDEPYRPRTLYGIAKATEASVCKYFHLTFGLKVIRTHTFNSIGPGQRSSFVPATFARQIVAMERGEIASALMVGNLAAQRDVTDIRDVVRGYVLAATLGQPGEVYNICSGRAPTIGEIVELLRSHAKIDFAIRQDPDRLKIADIAAQRGDPSRLRAKAGWEPEFQLNRTLADVMEQWRAIA
jgi:GDP-4-dehydro-6-deoxy-D-mannose reductase